MRSDEFRIRADIDLDALIFNMESMKKALSAGTGMIAVIKSDAYGHGAVYAAHTLEALPYLWGFAVATIDEAVRLRENGVKKPVLILGPVYSDYYDAAVRYDIRQVIFTKEEADALSKEAKRQGKKAYAHIAVDTGMGRIGVSCDDEGVKTVKEITEYEDIEFEGIFTHFPKADIKDISFTLKQTECFKGFISKLKEKGVTFKLHHCANSACIMNIRQADMDLVRAGISLYGLMPSKDVEKSIELKPVLALKSHIVYIKEVAPGTEISYGGTFKADRTMKIATIPAGYGDGYPRGLSNNGCVLIRGKRAKITGRVCMDQFMVDITDIPDAALYDEVTLVGCDKDDRITMEELASMYEGGFNYEIPCQLTARVPRIYYREGKRCLLS